MSRSNSIEIKNPSTRFYEWSGENGALRYFDKSKGVKGERVTVPIPFNFLVLDTLSTIKGFSDADKSGYWSNEVRDLKKEVLIVKNKKGEQAKGLYSEISGSRNIVGAKYCQSVYVAYKEGDNLILGNIQMTGSCLSSWIDFRKKNNVLKGAITIISADKATKGKTEYFVPVFAAKAVSEMTEAGAKELDKILQNYLTIYFERNRSEAAAQHPAEVHTGRGTLTEYEHTIADAPQEPEEKHHDSEMHSFDDIPF